MIKLILFLFISILIIGCETCNDCGPVNNSPYFNLSILNSTSLDTLTVDSGRYEVNLATIDTLLRDFQTALEEDSLNMGDFYQFKIDSLLVQESIFSDSLNYVKTQIREVEDRLVSIASVNGIADLFRREDGELDSASSFRIPLNAGAVESRFEIDIVGKAGLINRFLRVSYTLEDTVINNRITKSAKNLQIVGESDFKSVAGPFGCAPIINCSSNQLNIYVEI